MSRPRDSILNLFDPLFSVQPSTPPPCPSPELGSDKENSAPLGDSPITFTKFFNRTYTRYKAQLPHPLPKGRLIDFGDPNVSYDSLSDDGENDENEVPRDQEPVVHHEAGDAQGTLQRRPLADIALGDGTSRSSPVSIPKKVGTAAAAGVFGSPSSFCLVRPTPAPSSSPLASVINAINGTAMSPPSPSPLSPPSPSASHIVTPTAPPSPSPTRRQPRPGATLHASPDADARRVSVDLQASLSVHFGESSFDLLKDKILFPENDSLGDLELDLDLEEAVLAGEGVLSARTESESEPDLDDVLSARLKDMFMASDDEEAAAKPGILMDVGTKTDQDGTTPTSPVTSHTVPTPPLPVRQFIRPRTNRLQAPTQPHPAPPAAAAVPAFHRRSARASISALPAPIAAQRITKKANKADVRKTALSPPLNPPNLSAPSSSAAGVAPPRTMFLGGVQRPGAHAKSASVSLPPRAPTSQQGRPAPPTLATASRTSLVTGAGAGPRPSGLRPPTSRAGSSGIVAPRASVAAAVGGATRLSMAVGVAVGSRAVGSSSGVVKPVTGKSDGVRMMRRV